MTPPLFTFSTISCYDLISGCYLIIPPANIEIDQEQAVKDKIYVHMMTRRMFENVMIFVFQSK